jgi:competence protein ComEC
VLHKEIPFLRIGLPLCCGIISGLYFHPDITFLIYISVIVISGFVISLWFNKYQANQIYGITLTISLFICGLILYTNEKNSLTVLKPSRTIFTCTVSDYPEEKGNSSRIIVKLNSRIEGTNSIPVKGSIVLYNKKDPAPASIMPGDLLLIRCSPVEIVNRGNPYEFDYRFFMENQGIRYCAFTNSSDIIKHSFPAHRNLVHRALIARQKIIDMFRSSGIKGERLALVSAITLGQKSMLDPEQKNSFMKAGVMHIMAVSGLHAVILSMFMLYLLFFMKRKFNTYRIIITIVVLWAFAFVTGLTPSVLRATFMFSFLQAGKLMKRPSNGINSVLASAFFLILIRPSVIFDAGFLLSYSAVIYIICFYQDLYLKLHFKNWLNDKIWQSAVVTVVAQLGTLPLTIMLFNRFPTYFILANITIVPVSNLLIVTGCLIPLFFHIHFLCHIIAIVLNYLTGLTEMLTFRAASLPYSTIENIGITVPECIFLTITIFLFTWFILKKKSVPVIYPAVFLVLFVSVAGLKDFSTKNSNELIIYNTPGYNAIGLRTGKILNLYSDTTYIGQEVKRHAAVLGLKIKAVQLVHNFYILKAGSKKVLITSCLDNKIFQKMIPDIIVITGPKPEISFDLDPEIIQRTIVISASVKRRFYLPGNAVNDSLHFVNNSGAFIKRI